MDTALPFGLPGATALYISLYVLTLAVHVIFMSYVLAGTGYVAAAAVLGRARDDAIAGLLRDWLPFGLGAAITAGVAPLLFLQILYKHSFYTANLLLFHRWMAVVPVLLIGFYLLYLGKSKTIERWGGKARIAASVAAFACFAVTAYSWTENHLLAMDRGQWVEFYATGRKFYTSDQLLPRFMLWLAGTAPIMAVIVGWQVWQKHRADAAPAGLPYIAVAGLLVSAGAGVLYVRGLDPASQAGFDSGAAGPYLIVLGMGVAAQLGAWLWVWRTRALSPRILAIASAGAVVMIVATAAIRESIRLARLDLATLSGLHERAADAGGLGLFFGFLLANGAIIGVCFWLTRRGLRDQA